MRLSKLVSKKYDFDLGDLSDTKTSEQIFIERLKNSELLCKAFLYVVGLTIKKRVSRLTVKELSGLMKISRDHTRRHLETMLDCKVVLSRVQSTNGSKGKTKTYILNRNGEHYKQFIPVAKKVLGLK